MYVSVLLFGVLGTITLIDQIRKIWGSRSAPSVSGTAVITTTAMFGSFLIYGIHISSGSMIFHGILRATFWIPVLVGFFLYGKSDWRHWALLGTYILVLMGMSWKPFSVIGVNVFPFVGVWFSFVQAYTIVEKKARGKVSIANQIVPCLSACTWAAYAFYRKDMPLTVSCTLSVASYFAVMIAWMKYPNPPSNAN